MDLTFLFQLLYCFGVKANLLNNFFLSLVTVNGPHSTLNGNLYSWGWRKEEKLILMMIFFITEMKDLYNPVSVLSHPVSLNFLWLTDAGVSFLHSMAFKLILQLFNKILTFSVHLIVLTIRMGLDASNPVELKTEWGCCCMQWLYLFLIELVAQSAIAFP